MKHAAILLLIAFGLNDRAFSETVGTVDFQTSCSTGVQPAFNRGMALLHDFWYKEAQHQFERIAKTEPDCAMAQWGLAMSEFHQIWNRPSEKVMARGLAELQKAQSLKPKTQREREYVLTLRIFFAPGKSDFQTRIEAYAAGMSELYSHYPDDLDAGAFYALALLAETAPDDTSLQREKQALLVLKPLFAKKPEHPGVLHYIIHACDTPVLAAEGLAAAEAYGGVAPSAPHAVHMPGHIFARLGRWQQDIDVNEKSVAASQQAQARRQSGAMDQFHAYEFLLYAYLQSGEEARAKDVITKTSELMAGMKALPDKQMLDMDMDMNSDIADMAASYHGELSAFYDLEMRDWRAAAVLQPEGKEPTAQINAYWARSIANGHLQDAKAAEDSLKNFDSLLERVKTGKYAFFVGSTTVQVMRGEVKGWTEFAAGNRSKAEECLRKAADLQDKVGQGEVDIPAREMLADMLLEWKRPQEALAEYERSLAMSPNRFNGLFNAGMAAEAIGEKKRASEYYALLLKSTDNGAQSNRSELAQAKSFMSANQLAGGR